MDWAPTQKELCNSIAPAPPVCCRESGLGVTEWREGRPPLLPPGGLALASIRLFITTVHMRYRLDPCMMSHDLLLTVFHVSA